MNTRMLFLFTAVAFLAGAARAAQAPTTPPPERTLAVVVVDSLHRGRSDQYHYELLSQEFENAFTAQHWPLTVTFERFAANTSDHPLELQIFYKGIYNEFGERVYKAWTILIVNGVKHDFGIVEYRYMPRPGEQLDDVMHKMFLGAGQRTAALIAPFIAPAATATR